MCAPHAPMPPCLQAIALCATDEVKKLKCDGCGGNSNPCGTAAHLNYTLYIIHYSFAGADCAVIPPNPATEM